MTPDAIAEHVCKISRQFVDTTGLLVLVSAEHVRVMVPAQGIAVVHLAISSLPSRLADELRFQFHTIGIAGISYVFTCGPLIPGAWVNWRRLGTQITTVRDLILSVRDGKLSRSSASAVLTMQFNLASEDADHLLDLDPDDADRDENQDVPLQLVKRDTLDELAVWLDAEEQAGDVSTGPVIATWQQHVACELERRRAEGEPNLPWPDLPGPLALCTCGSGPRCVVHDDLRRIAQADRRRPPPTGIPGPGRPTSR